MKVFVVLACVFVCVYSHPDLLSVIQRCHSSDSQCLRRSAQAAIPIIAAGIPKYGMETLDPMLVDHAVATQAGLTVNFINTVVKGLRHCLVLDLTRQDDEMSIQLKCSVVLSGNYSLKGDLMDIPITGDGPYKIFIHDIVVTVGLRTAVRTEGSERYWTVRTWKHSTDVRTKVVFHFENLLPGNKRLAKTVMRIANRNWRDIFHDMAPPIVKAIVARIVNETSKLFNKVPISQLSLDN